MKLFLTILWFLIFNKLVLFWFWLWQLKEYHWGRFKAHFETRGLEKILHSFYGRRVPKFTPKIILIFLMTLFLEGLFLILNSPFVFLVVLFFIPLIASVLILIFQIPTRFLGKIILKKAELKRKKFKDLTVIGITGSYGKTATKDFLASILAKKFRVLKTEKHINSELGIARTILKKLKEEDEIFVAEIGAYQRGKIGEVCRMIKPKIGILTGINEQHMSTFGSQEDIIKGKYELIENLPENGLSIFNGENKYCRFLYLKTKINKKLVEKRNGLDNFLPWDKENFLLAAEVSRFLGVEDKIIKETAENYSGTLEIKKKDNLEIIDSTYSANPKSLIAHLDYLKKIKGEKILVMPSLIELGEAASQIHREIGEKIAQVCSLAIITRKDYHKELKEGGGERVIFSSDSEEIIRKIKEFSNQKTIILLESRVPKKLVDYLFN